MDNENSLVPVILMLSQWTQNKCGADIMMLVLFAIFSQKSVVDTPDAGSDKNFFGFELDPLKAIDIDTEDDTKQNAVFNAETFYG